jgi:non-specific serine/threonine protein kinase
MPDDLPQSAPARPPQPRPHWRWRFESCCFDEASLILTVRGQAVELERRPLELLALLLAHAGEVVTKDEILAALWTDRDVSEASLTKCMARLRRALGDAEHSIIHTVHGYGYRFAVPVKVEPSPQTAPLLPAALELQPGEAVPRRPDWRLVRRLGTGGFGDVWLVEQARTRQQRVLKFAQDAAGLAGLRREITLGRLLREGLGPRDDLVRITDSNLEDSPYFLEIVWYAQGNLADWAESQGGLPALELALRLDLMAQIADALAAAHAMGVLHKDLKPANVLMRLDAAGRPGIVLTDFGSGRALDPARLDAFGITRADADVTTQGSTSGTQMYRAPELGAGRAPTVQADIFALGVMLFQMVAADFRQNLAPGWEDAVADPLLRQDIALAAAGDPARRLGDAAELARRLRSLPARRAAQALAERAAADATSTRRALERAQARRAPVLVALGLLLVGFTASTALYIRADRAQAREEAATARAQTEAARARAVTLFLTDDLFSAANPLLGADPNIPVKKVLAVAAADLDHRFPPASPERSAIEAAIGGAYAGLSDTRRALPLLNTALAAIERQSGAASPQAQAVRLAMADLAERTADWAALRAAGRAILAAQPADAAIAARGRFAVEQADCETSQNDSLCVEKLRPLLAEFNRTLGPRDALTLRARDLLAYQLAEGQHFGEATAIARENVAVTQAQYGAEAVQTQDRRLRLGRILVEAGQGGEAIPLLEDVRHRLLEIFGTETEMSSRAAMQLAHGYAQVKRYDDGLRMMQAALDYNVRTHGEDFQLSRFAMNGVAKMLTAMGRPREAIPLAQKAFELQRAAEGPANEDTLWIEASLADALDHAGETARAEAEYRNIVAQAHVAFTHGEWDLGHFEYLLGALLAKEGKSAEARATLADSVAQLTRSLGPNDAATQSATLALSEASK